MQVTLTETQKNNLDAVQHFLSCTDKKPVIGMVEEMFEEMIMKETYTCLDESDRVDFVYRYRFLKDLLNKLKSAPKEQ